MASGWRRSVRLLVEQTQPRVVVLDLSAVFDVEYTVLKMLAEGEARMKERGISMWLVGLAPDVLAAVRRSPFGQAVGQEQMFFNVEDAVAAYVATQMARPSATQEIAGDDSESQSDREHKSGLVLVRIENIAGQAHSLEGEAGEQAALDVSIGLV